MCAVIKPRDLGNIAKDCAVGPGCAARTDRNQPEAQGLEFPKAFLSLQYIHGLERHTVIKKKLFGF